MILAAADCAENKGSPPPELKLAWQTIQWGTLPEPGGLRDQRVGELERMQAALATHDAISAWKRSKNWAKWSGSNVRAWRIVRLVQELRDAKKE